MDQHHRLPKILVNSIPKSGTHLLLQIITGIPGMGYKRIHFDINHKEPDDVSKEIEDIQHGDVIISHILHSHENADRLYEAGVKQIFISRDLRDVAVSSLYFILNHFHDHPLHPYLTEELLTHEERMLAVIQGVNFKGTELAQKFGFEAFPNIYKFNRQFYGWFNDPDVLCITFEDLIRSHDSRYETLNKIVDYLWEDLQPLQLKKEKIVMLMEKNINPSTSMTFRRGKIGSWRDEFTEEHKKAFKEIAGNVLIDLGYEQDQDW